jgi:hypothetical protein
MACSNSGLPSLWRSGSVAGEIINDDTLKAPADSPAIVTLSGSPPKLAIFL